MIQVLQAHSQTLYLLSLVALCSVLLAASIRASQIFIAMSKLSQIVETVSPNTSMTVTGSAFLPISVVKKLTLTSAISTALSCGIIAWAIFDRYSTGVVKHDNVHVLSRYDDRQFCMETKGSEWSFRACEPFPKDIVAGVTLTKLRFVYDKHMNCDDWTGRSELGYTAWRTPDDKPIISQFARPSSAGASCASPNRTTEARAGATEARARR